MTHTTSLKVAVVIPALNEERFIGRCLESLRALALPETSVRTCVVDNGSTDRTETLARQNGANWLVVPKHTIAHSRNRGAAAAGEVDILAFLDADSLADRQWIARALDRFRESADVVAVGSYPDVLESESNIFQRTWAELCRQEWRGKCEVDWLPAANLIVRRSAFWRMGGFNEHADFAGVTCHDALDAITHCLDTPRRVHAMLLNRDWHADLASLEHLAARPPEFIGMMGSRKRIAEVLAHLPATWTHLRNHLTAPVGLDLGAETPEEIAISIVAQLVTFERKSHC